MNSNEIGNQEPKKYDFGFNDDEDDDQPNQINTNFYQNENDNNINQYNNMNNNFNNNQNNNYNINQNDNNFMSNQNDNNFMNNQNDNNFMNNQNGNNFMNNQNNNNFNQFDNNQNQFNNNNFNFNGQNNQYGFNGNNYNMNNMNNNNYNNMNQNQPNQFQNNPNTNNNFNPNNYQNNNNQFYNPQQQNQKKIESKPKNPEKEKLKNAYNLFMQGINDIKKVNYEIGLDKFERIKATIEEVYPKIEKDENMKKITDDFLKQVNQRIDTTQKLIKQKYNYVPSYNYNGLDAKKEVAKFLKETELASQQRKKKFLSFLTDTKKKSKDSPSYYMNENRNFNNNNNNNVNNNANNNNNKPKDESQKIITNDLREKVLSEIVERKPDVKFSDVIGLKEAKEILREIIIVPNLRPDLFKGLRSPPRGLLLFGPPGTGKTMIAKAVATECKCTFFNISASSLTSKYLGESEKLVRTLFDLAHEMQPSVVFIDEIESILSKRKEDENDAMKRLKTEFLIQFDGVGSGDDQRVLIIGATNRPFDLDPGIIRRLPKRVYVGPINAEERQGFIKTIITQNKCNITDDEYKKIAEMCQNYSNSDLKELCREAAYEPLRELNVKSLQQVGELRPIIFEDFNRAVRKVKGTLTKKILTELENWNKEFGALS